MRNMSVMVLPRKSDRRLELSFKLLENPSQNKSHHNLDSINETVISLDIHNAMSLITQLESGIKNLMEDVSAKLQHIKSTPELAQEDPTHRKKA